MLANTRKSRPTNRNLTVKNDTVLAHYGITPSGYKNIMNYLENTICREDSDTLSPEELAKLQPYIEFARSTLKVTVPENYIEEKQQGGVVPYEFNNESESENSSSSSSSSSSSDVFSVLNPINELSNAKALEKLAKVNQERNNEQQKIELYRDREEWDNSITRRTVYGVLMMAQILNDVFGVKRKIDAAISELQAHDRFCEAYPQRLTQKQYKNAHRLWKLTGHHPPLDTAAALKEYVLKKGGKEAEILLKQLIRTHSEFRPRPAQEIEQEIRDKIRIPTNEVNVAHRYPSAVEEYVTGRWNGMVERIRQLHPTATRDAVYAVATEYLYQELNEFSQHHSGEQLAIAPPITDEFLQPHSNGQLANVSHTYDQFLKPHLNGQFVNGRQFVNGQSVIYNWPLDVVHSIIRSVSTIFSESDTPAQAPEPAPTPAPTVASKPAYKPKSVKPSPVSVISKPVKPFQLGSIADANTLEKAIHQIIKIYNRVEGAFGWKKGISGKKVVDTPFWCGRLTAKGQRVSGGAASPFICLVGDWHSKIEKDEKCKIPCTKNSGCLNIGATEYQTDPTTDKKFPVRTGLLSLAEEIWKTLGIPVIMNLESFIPSGSATLSNYTAVGEDSALKHTIAVSINCMAKPSFEKAIQNGRHTNTSTCLNSNIHFHLQDQRYNYTNIDSIYSNFKDMVLKLQKGDNVSAKQTVMSFLDNYNKSGIKRSELFSYLRFLYDNTKKIGDLFNHPTFKKHSKTYFEFSTLPEEIKKSSFTMMENNPILFKNNVNTNNGKLHQTLLTIVDYLEQENYDALYTFCSNAKSENYKHLTTVKNVNVVNFQQFMPDLESIRLIMTSGFALPISQFGSQHTTQIRDILVNNGWFEESVAFMPTDQKKCAERSNMLSSNPVSSSSSSNPASASSSSSSKKTSMIQPPNFYSLVSNGSNSLNGALEAALSPKFYVSPPSASSGKSEAVASRVNPNPHMLEQAAMRHADFLLPSKPAYHPPPAYPEAAASEKHRMVASDSNGTKSFYNSPVSATAAVTSPMVQNNNNFQTKLTRHRKEMNEIMKRNKRSSESIDPRQFPPSKYTTSHRLSSGEKFVKHLSQSVLDPLLPDPAYPQLENGWFRRLRAKQFENLTEEEKKYVDSLSWKKMGDLTVEDKDYLRHAGILYNRTKKNLPKNFYKMQHQRGVELKTNRIQRLEKEHSAREREARQQASLGVIERTRRFFTGTPVNIENKGIPHRITLRPSNRQKELNEKMRKGAKQGGTRRKQKRSNSTRRVKRQSKPVYPSCK
jgi:hypothetical protein